MSQDINLWVTNYHHIMEDHRALVKWYSGSGLRPYLDSIYDEEERADFCKEYEELLQASYPLQKSGKLLFPFTRIFFMALK